MKLLPFAFFILCLSACSSQKTSSNAPVNGFRQIALLQDENDSLWVQVPEASTRLSLSDPSQHSLLLGQLKANSRLQLSSQTIMMTSISMQMAVAPESGYLDIPDSQIGKWAIVKGLWAGDLYEAEIICVLETAPDKARLQSYSEGTTNILEECQ